MAHRRGRRRHHRSRRHRRMPSVSSATYTELVKLDPATNARDTTVLATQKWSEIQNLETQNRKLLGVAGTFSVQSAAEGAVLVCHYAHPEVDGIPAVSDWDPFETGPTGAAGAYTGRPSPRPFGRRTFVVGTGASNNVEIVNHIYRVRSQRLIRPGWNLTTAVYVRDFGANAAVSVRGVLKATVAG